jgi:hypothetical protein
MIDDSSLKNIKKVQRYKREEENMFSGVSKTTLKNSANFKENTVDTKSNDASNVKQPISKIENRNFIIIESLKQKRDSVVSEQTKSVKSPRNNEFLHVFSTEFLTKEEIERNEKVVQKHTAVRPTPIKVIEDEIEPKIISQASEVEMKRNQNDDTDQFATAYLRDSMPEP